MEHLDHELDKVAENIKALEGRRKSLGETLSQLNEHISFDGNNPDIKENKFISKIEQPNYEKMKIAGIDGGILSSRYHGFDLVLTRAAAVVFDMHKGSLIETTYHPDPFPTPKAIPYYNLESQREFGISTGLQRVKQEVSLGIETVKKFKPDILLMDGSIIPHGADHPDKEMEVYEQYKEVISLYDQLYTACEENNTKLAGVVEDSSGQRLSKIISENVIPGLSENGSAADKEALKALEGHQGTLDNLRDSNLLYYVLQAGERSCIFSYTQDHSKHQVLRDLKDWEGQINSFYMKPVVYDRPVRIDFLGDDVETANQLASVIMELSMHNETYACPSILIEADARAKLSEKDIEQVYARLKDKVGDVSMLFKLRRELRPF